MDRSTWKHRWYQSLALKGVYKIGRTPIWFELSLTFFFLKKSPLDKSTKFKSGCFASTQPPRLVIAIAAELGITDYSSIINWELELFDTQPAQLGGLSKELLFAPRIDDKLCSFSALEALIVATSAKDFLAGSAVSLVGLFDDEEIGSRLRQGAGGNLMSSIIERVIEAFSDGKAGAVSY